MCKPGYRLNETSNSCDLPCPADTYSDGIWNSTCSSCPPHTTTLGATASNSSSLCLVPSVDLPSQQDTIIQSLQKMGQAEATFSTEDDNQAVNIDFKNLSQLDGWSRTVTSVGFNSSATITFPSNFASLLGLSGSLRIALVAEQAKNTSASTGTGVS